MLAYCKHRLGEKPFQWLGNIVYISYFRDRPEFFNGSYDTSDYSNTSNTYKT